MLRVAFLVLICSALLIAKHDPGAMNPSSASSGGEGFSLSATCPASEGLQRLGRVSEGEVLSVVSRLTVALQTGNLLSAMAESDPAYWPLLLPQLAETPAEPVPITEERVATSAPASRSAYADLVANHCGKAILDLSWWLEIYPAGTPETPEARAKTAGLRGHYYLIKRADRWFVWGAKSG